MARPQSPDYDKRREAILETARQLYAKRGFQGTSVADLAAACETSKSLIYHYFPSKDDTLSAVMATHLDALVEAVEQACGRKAIRVDKPMPAGDVRETWADISVSRRDLGYEPRVGLHDGIARFVAWYREYAKI